MIKTFFILTLLSITILADELSWVDEQVNAIKPAREGIENSMMDNIDDPFIFLKKNGYKQVVQKKQVKPQKQKTVKKTKKKYRAKLTLEMIINSSALINGDWYRVGDKVKNYTVTKVEKDKVSLLFDGKKIVLSMQNKNSTLKFKRN